MEISLEYPNNIVIETTALCNLRCFTCGRRNAKRVFGTMNHYLVEHILGQIAAWNKDIRVWYCFLGEPLLINEKLYKYIEYGNKLGIKNHIINTNGLLLDLETSKNLIKAGLTEIYISVDAVTKETYNKIRYNKNHEHNFTTLSINIDQLLSIKQKSLKVVLQFLEVDHNKHEKIDFISKWAGKTETHIKLDAPSWSGLKKKNLTERYPCPWILDTMGIYWDGNVPYCVLDWQNKTIIDNAIKSTIQDIWYYKTRPLQSIHINKEWKKLPNRCKQCQDWSAKYERKIID